MSVIGRTRSVTRQGLKVQRRVVLAQALFWPTVLLTGLAVGSVLFAVKRSARRRESLPDVGGVADGASTPAPEEL